MSNQLKLNKTEKQIISQIRDLFQEPKKWTSYAMARNQFLESCSPFSRDAICWCAMGALRKFSELEDPNEQKFLLFDLMIKIDRLINKSEFADLEILSRINDLRGREAVLDFLEFALNYGNENE